MEIGRVIFILNRGVIQVDGGTPPKSEVRVQQFGMEKSLPDEGLMVASIMARTAAQIVENTLKIKGLNVSKENKT